MHFPSQLYLMSAFGAAVMTALSRPLWRKFCRRFGFVDDPGERKIHAESMPLAGGLAIWTGWMLCFVAVVVVIKLRLVSDETTNKLFYGLSHRWRQLAAIVLGAT